MKTIFLLGDLWDRYGDRDGYKLITFDTAENQKEALAKIKAVKVKYPKSKFIILDVL